MAYSYERDYIMPLCGSLRAELAPIVDYQLSDKVCRFEFEFMNSRRWHPASKNLLRETTNFLLNFLFAVVRPTGLLL